MTDDTQEPKQERGERRRAMIVEAATEAFLEHGFAGASLDQIVRRAGGSRRDMYTWFGNKAGLFGAVIGAQLKEIFDALEQADFSSDSPRDVLREFGVLFVEVLTTPRVLALYRVVLGEGGRFPELGLAFYKAGPAQAHAQLSADLQRWSDAGKISIANPARAARFILEMMKADLQTRALFDPTYRPSKAEIESCVEEAVSLLFSGMDVPKTPSL